MLLDPLALTVFDDEHSQEEDRWFTLGTSSEDKLLTVAHTFEEQSDSAPATVRIISARPVKRREREQYENEPRQVHTMSTPQTPPDDDLPAEKAWLLLPCKTTRPSTARRAFDKSVVPVRG